jgi:hypothetical protein
MDGMIQETVPVSMNDRNVKWEEWDLETLNGLSLFDLIFNRKPWSHDFLIDFTSI